MRRLASLIPTVAMLLAPVQAATTTAGTPRGMGMMPAAAPDEVVMNSGEIRRGLILRNSAVSLLLDTDAGEIEIPKDQIRRIREGEQFGDTGMGVTKPGRLPDWQSIVRDFRNHDSTRSFHPIPATAIDNGFLRNIPYISFRVNKTGELNIYGDPHDPVAVELGAYHGEARSRSHRRMLREFLAGHLSTRGEVAALYRLDLDQGGEMRTGRLAVRCTTPAAPDAYGGWWLCIYDPARLGAARVGAKEYARLTRPFAEVNDGQGSMRAQADDSMPLTGFLDMMGNGLPWLQGFTRDKRGVFRLDAPAPP